MNYVKSSSRTVQGVGEMSRRQSALSPIKLPATSVSNKRENNRIKILGSTMGICCQTPAAIDVF